MEQSPDPVAETLLKNSTGKAGIDKLDWDKVKNNITIYEYFPKNWIQVPELSDNVSGFETDAATQNGYSKMFQLLQKDIKKVFAVASSQVNKSIKKGSEEFAKEMMNEYMMNGYSFISKPAAIIISIIHIKMAKLAAEFVAEKQKLDSLITQKQEEKNNAGKDDNCGQRDRRNNQFLSEVNPMIRKLFAKYSEEYRVLMNAFCTWIWYESGNIKNTSMSFCLGYTEFYANWLRDAIAAQKRYSPCGIEGIRADRENPVPLPKIPSFNCPTVVSMPVGMDWHALDIAMKNFDGNSLNINKSAGTPLPNMSIAYGIGGKMIAQPGQAPFTKIANGTILPEYGTDKDDSHLNSIAPSPSEREYQAALEKRLSELLKKTLQKMLNNMMLDNCDELQSLKDLEKKKFWEEKKRKVDESLKKHEDIDKMADDYTKEITIKRLSEEIQKMYDEMSKSKYNPQPSLNSSMQAPNTFTPQPGLFK
jgi:hypothetical protein